MILILGKDGMLGSMLDKSWEGDHKSVGRDKFDASSPDIKMLAEADWVINAIGVIKPKLKDNLNAIIVNSVFPYVLPEKTIQIATDCVFSGKKGNYTETDEHDAVDVYGKTKSLGEAPHIKNLRCSIIGPNGPESLLDWFMSQEVSVNGFINHLWNGITTYHFSKIVQGIIKENIELPSIQHVVPANKVSKSTLLGSIATVYKKDIKIARVRDAQSIDRTLSTVNPDMNIKLWKAAGYKEPPTITQMLKELKDFEDSYAVRN